MPAAYNVTKPLRMCVCKCHVFKALSIECFYYFLLKESCVDVKTMALLRKITRQLRTIHKFAVIYSTGTFESTFYNELFKGYVFDTRKYLCSIKEHSFVNTPNPVLLNESSEFSQNESVNNFNKELLLFLEDIGRKRIKYDDVMYIIKRYNNNSYSVNPQVGMILLRCCSEMLPEILHETRINLAHSIFNLLQTKNCELNVDMYNMILQIYIRSNYTPHPEKFLKNMKVNPNARTYELLVHTSAHAGDHELTNTVIQMMKKKNYPISINVYNSLILLHAIQGKIKEAHSILESMELTFIEPSNETFAYLALGFAKDADFASVVKILESHKLEVKNIMDIIKFSDLFRNTEWLNNILKFLPQHVDIYDSSIISTVIELTYGNQARDAFDIIHWLLSNKKKKIELPKYYLKAMAEAETDMKTIMEIIESLDSSQTIINVLTDLAEIYLLKGQRNLAFNTFEILEKKGQPVKPHYYWPLLVSAAKIEGEAGLFNVLKHMKKLSVKLDFDTLFNYVLPFINFDYPVTAYKKLLDNSIKNSELLTIVISFLLKKGLYNSVISLRTKMLGKIETRQVLEHLVKRYIETNDIKQCALVLKMFNCKSNNVKKLLSIENDGGLIINEFVKAVNNYKLPSSTSTNNVVLNTFKSSKNITPTFKHPRNMNIEELELHLIELQSKKMNTRGVLRLLLQAYCGKDDLKRAEEIRNEIEENKFPWSAGMRSSLFGLYAKQGMLDKAYEQFNAINNEFNLFVFDDFKIITFAQALIKHGQVESAMEILRWHQHVKGGPALVKNCWELLNTVAHSEHSRYVDQILNILLEKGYCNADNVVLGPVIRSHLLKGDISSAVDNFKRFVIQYKQTPLKQELMKYLAELSKDDFSSAYFSMLTEVHSLVKNIHGKQEADANLVVTLAQCNKLSQLNSFLSKNTVSVELLKNCLNGLPENNKLSTVINILDCYKKHTKMNISPLYDLLLSIYSREGKYKEAAELWKDLQEQRIKVNENFKKKIFNFLKVNNVYLSKDAVLNSNGNKKTRI